MMPAVKPTPTNSAAAIPAQAVGGVAARRAGLAKLAGVAETSAAYSSKAFAKSNSCVMLKGMNCSVLGVAKAPKNKLWDKPSPGWRYISPAGVDAGVLLAASSS
jgi:hypothetical protein